MTCAKRHVTCTIRTLDGEIVTGTNECRYPQTSCPREAGEGYLKCLTICGQHAHAEIMATADAVAAGFKLEGATAVISGHNYACAICCDVLHTNGITDIQFVQPEEDDG